MAQGKDGERPLIIVKKYKRVAAGHHGGAWKVAYADFVTAMMAFFLVMWLVTAVSKEQRAAIFDYFKNPSMEPGKSVKPAPGQMGPGGASTSPIDLGGGLDAPKTTDSAVPGIGSEQQELVTSIQDPKAMEEAREKAEEKEKLESLMDELKEAISKSQALEPFKDQLLLDITPEGLRIQIIDAQNRPMFDIGSARLKNYTDAILRELTPYLNSVSNRISLTGHTDQTPYGSVTGYTNWDLSSDRANAARRSLEAAGLAKEKVARIVGLSSSVLFDKQNPRSPVNRRISIIVMTRDAEEEALRIEVPTSADAAAAASPAADAAAALIPAASAPASAAAASTTAPAAAPVAPGSKPAGTTSKPAASAAKSAAAASSPAASTTKPAAASSPAASAPKPAAAGSKPAGGAAKPAPAAAPVAPMYPIPTARN